MEREINRRMDRCGVCSDAVTVLICCGNEEVKPKGETLDLPVNLRFHYHLWP